MMALALIVLYVKVMELKQAMAMVGSRFAKVMKFKQAMMIMILAPVLHAKVKKFKQAVVISRTTR